EHPLKSKIMSHYNRIVSSVQSHTKLPSFMAKAENLAQNLDFNWNGEKYILDLTDTNNVLANYSFSANEDGIEFSINENVLTITAKNLPSDSVTITANKTSSKRRGIVTWTDEKIGPNGGIQDVVTYAQSVSDPVQGFVKLNVVKKEEALVEIVKKDAETGKVIPVAGIGFKVHDCATGEFVVQNDTDTYYTNSTGKLTLPETLKYGRYELVEVQTAEGYVLDGTPVEFTVDGSKEIVTVEKKNTAQKGKITISKNGEIFSSVKESDGKYHPIYEVQGLEGAVYEIKAVEDISTPDGTHRYAKGDIVATLTTDKNGTATTEPLYLGKYEIRETSAPYGMVINDEVRSVELAYAGQEVEITEISVSFVNERQKAAVQLSKLLEQDETFGIGMNGEITAVSFGLYASENLTAADGSVIPKDGLLEIISCDKNGRAEFKTDIPVGAKLYVKEIATDSHYLASNRKYPVNFEYAGQDIANVKLLTNDGKSIKNNLIRGKIVGKKVDEDGNVIEGAVFGLFKTGTENFSKETAILTAQSDENGAFVFDNVPYGDWLVRELKPTAGFVLNETVYNVTVSEDEQTVEIEVVNEFITGELELTKRDVSSGKLLPNAGFRIKDESGEIAAEGYTDENGIAKFTLRYGR
ncbi:MAG: collagen binding domain-containing protein, partial [Acutalibacteraceae bacterium]